MSPLRNTTCSEPSSAFIIEAEVTERTDLVTSVVDAPCKVRVFRYTYRLLEPRRSQRLLGRSPPSRRCGFRKYPFATGRVIVIYKSCSYLPDIHRHRFKTRKRTRYRFVLIEKRTPRRLCDRRARVMEESVHFVGLYSTPSN